MKTDWSATISATPSCTTRATRWRCADACRRPRRIRSAPPISRTCSSASPATACAKESDMTARSAALALNRYSVAVWRRNLIVWRRLIWPSLTTNVLDPLIFLFAFGYGLGAVVQQIGGMDYLTFVVPGMMCYAAMFAASFEATISTYARFSLQRTWDAILATPVTLTELMLGEMLWAATKGMFSAVCVIVIGTVWGGVPHLAGALLTLPVIAIGANCFACYGLVAAVNAET